MNRIFYYFVLKLINTFLVGTSFFTIKRFLLNMIGISIGENSKVVGPLYIGRAATLVVKQNCWIGADFKVYGNGEVFIGDNCDVAPEVTFITGSHQIGPPSKRAGDGISFKCQVSNGVWIGSQSTFLNNVKISEGVIIGAKSLVNRDCIENSLYVGSPAVLVKSLEVY